MLPNFAMTDYASQGKTRPDNVVDLTNCTSHQSYYTALSRSASAAGTIIVQSFSPGPITGGASGWLRQEYCELELLDDITKLAYQSMLPAQINGETRNVQIHQYRAWRGQDYMPKNIHKAIAWSLQAPYKQLPLEKQSQWKFVEKKSNKNSVFVRSQESVVPLQAAVGSVAIRGIKRKAEVNDCKNIGKAKKFKPNGADSSTTSSGPVGFVWDHVNWSCAYDSLFTIIYYIWSTNPHKWNRYLRALNPNAALLASSFQKMYNGKCMGEHARDLVRAQLHEYHSLNLPYGHRGTAWASLCREMLASSHGTQVWVNCTMCSAPMTSTAHEHMYTFECIDYNSQTISDLVQSGMKRHCTGSSCMACGKQMEKYLGFVKAPIIISVLVDPGHRVSVDKYV